MPDHAVMPIVRVAVLAAADDGGRLTDMALPAGLPLREILPAVQRIAHPAETAPPPGPVSLAPIGGAPFSLDATLDTVGVVDGDLLALQPLPAGPAAPRIVEDIADAAVIFSAAREKPWNIKHIRRGAATAMISLILVGTGLSVAHRLTTEGLAGLVTVGGLAVATIVAALLSQSRSSQLSTALALTAAMPVAAAAALAVPGTTFGAPQILLAAGAVGSWALIAIFLVQRAIAVFTAAVVTAGGLLSAAAAASLWTLSATALGCGLVALALLVTVQAPQLAAFWARFPVPVLPAPGDPTPSAHPLRVLEDLPRRVRLGEAHQTGFIAGAMLLAVTGSLLLVGPAGASPWAWYVAVAAAAGSALRARVWDSAACKAWLLAHSYVLTAALVVLFAATGRYPAAWGALLALAVLVAALVVLALNPRIADPETYSVPLRRLVGFAAAALDASLIPVMAHLVGLFAWVLDR